MGRIKCVYCNSFFEDSLKNCPNCGAVNDQLIRFASTTPKTIQELKDWYAERHLPPEHITRFFIGRDVEVPCAFGIFEENGTFTVYKNKSDGSRAIRYQGSDEAYAVNEIYMKLKEEILNQKNRNLVLGRPSSGAAPAYRRTSPQYRQKTSSSRIPVVILLGILYIAFNVIALNQEQRYRITEGYYSGGSLDSVFYINPVSDERWKYDAESADWILNGKSSLPDGISKDDKLSLEDIRKKYSYEIPSCTDSHAFIDRHHPAVTQGYYINEGSLYYYLNNNYGKNSGWYTYDDDGWEYYCSSDDKEKLGDDLWYDTNEYYNTVSYSDLDTDAIYYFNDNETWNANFSDTSFYKTYEKDLSDYNNRQSNTNKNTSSSSNKSFWDDDDDDDSIWNWSSDDSWDSGWSDWDSDW